MLYVINDRTNPYFNLALEEHLLKNSDREYFMLWQNAPSVIVGRNQNTLSEINTEYIKEHSIPVVRRLTGGGAVFHDLGNLNFSFIVNDSESGEFDFKKYAAPIIEALRRLSVNAEFSGRNDMTIDGKKFSGNAQCRYKGRLLHHGTLLFNASVSDIASALNVDTSKFEGKAVRSVESRVTNIASHLKTTIKLEEFKQLIAAVIKSSHNEFEPYTLSCEDIEETEKLEKEIYALWEWNYGSSPAYNFTNKKRFTMGSVEVFLNVEGGVIRGARLNGDFFGENNVLDIENALLSVPHEINAVRRALSGLEIPGYMAGIGIEELIGILF